MTNEKKYDVFISHSSINRAEAESLVAGLEKRKLKCWIAPRDLMPGAEYGAEIIRGIKGSKALIVLLSADAIDSRAVRAEVERAASMDKLVIPIAIEEVTLTHGLEFFLSLSQRVDLFDGPKEAHIDRVADMINSGLAQPAKFRKRNAFSRLAYKVGGSMLSGIAILAVILGYFYWDAAKQERQIQEQLEQVTQQLLPKQTTVLKNIKESDLKPEFDVRWSGSTPSISLKKVAGVPLNSQLLYSADGENYVLGNGIGDFSFGMRLFVKIRLAQETIGPFDFSDELHLAVRDSFSQSSVSSNVTCSVRGCDIYKGICGNLWDKFTLSGEAGQDGEIYYTVNCAGKKPVARKTCISVPYDIPALHPESILYGTLHADGIEPYVFEVKANYSSASQFTGDNNGKPYFVELEPASNEEITPFAVTWYKPLQPTNVNPFRVELGIGGCVTQGMYEPSTSLHYDTDGRGLIESNMRGFSIPQPLSGTVQIAFDAKSGVRYGPYIYSFDVTKVVQARIDAADKPKLTCTYRNRPDGSTEWFCPWREPSTAPIGYEVFAWARVKQIRYGKRLDNLSNVVIVDLPISEVIRRSQIRDTFSLDLKPVIDIRPPMDWTDLYFEMEYTDGTKTSVQRIQLRT